VLRQCVESLSKLHRVILLYQHLDVLIQEAGLSSLDRVDSHPPTRVVQEVTSCSVDDARSFNCSGFKEIPDIDVFILLQLYYYYYCYISC